jgi:hypothetical protein
MFKDPDKKQNNSWDDSLKFAYNENLEMRKSQEAVIKFLGVDNDSIPEKFYKGKKKISVDGDPMEY